MKYQVLYSVYGSTINLTTGETKREVVRKRVMAEFYFRFEAEKYITVFHGNEKYRYEIVEIND